MALHRSCLLVPVVIGLLGSASAAEAATVSVEPEPTRALGQVVGFRSSGPERNVITITRSLPGGTLVTDTGTPLTVGEGCVAVNANSARCAQGLAPLALIVEAGPGDDRLVARDAGLESRIDMGAGNDIAEVGGTSTFIGGGAGNDVLRSIGGIDQVLDGGSGDDRLMSGPAGDYMKGGPGDDSFSAAKGDDNIDAEPGELRAGSCADGIDEVSYTALARRPAPADCERVRLIDDQAKKSVVVTVSTRVRQIAARSVLFDALRLETGGSKITRRLELRSADGALWGRGVSSHTKTATGYYSSPIRFALNAAGRRVVAAKKARLAKVVGIGKRRTSFTVQLRP